MTDSWSNSPGRYTAYSISSYLANLSFRRLAATWLSLVLVFSLVYYCVTVWDGKTNYLSEASSDGSETKAESFIDHLYFSLSTATRLGYGDIVPKGTTNKFITITSNIIFTVLYCTIVSKVVLRNRTKTIEAFYNSEVGDRVDNIIVEMINARNRLEKSIKSIGTREISHIATEIGRNEESIKERYHQVKTLIENRQGSEHLFSQGSDSAEMIISVSEDVVYLLEDLCKRKGMISHSVVLDKTYMTLLLGEEMLKQLSHETPKELKPRIAKSVDTSRKLRTRLANMAL